MHQIGRAADGRATDEALSSRRVGVMIMAGPAVRRVLVATDLTETSPTLIAVGVDAARRFGAELIALYVFDPAAYEEILGETLMPLDTYRSRLRIELLEQVEAAGAEMRTRVEVVDGRNVALEILYAAARFDADLIVLGTHARTGWRRAVHGRFAEEVLRHARTMVLVTPLDMLAAMRQPALTAS
jgi:nucleotide-binding universal stress UspA family protein